jgi:hypothetical protein
VLAVGDDRSDEDMFTAIEHYADTPRHPAEVRVRAGAGQNCMGWLCMGGVRDASLLSLGLCDITHVD